MHAQKSNDDGAGACIYTRDDFKEIFEMDPEGFLEEFYEDEEEGGDAKKHNDESEVRGGILRVPDAISFPKTQSFAAGIPSPESDRDVSLWQHKTNPRDKGAREWNTYRKKNK